MLFQIFYIDKSHLLSTSMILRSLDVNNYFRPKENDKNYLVLKYDILML